MAAEMTSLAGVDASSALISLRLKSPNELMATADSSYAVFTEFVDATAEQHRTPLERLSFPLFSHYFVQLIDAGHKTTGNQRRPRHPHRHNLNVSVSLLSYRAAVDVLANEFFEKHSPRFKQVDDSDQYDADLKVFAACLAMNGSAQPSTFTFDERFHAKSVIHLPPKSHKLLLRHLERSKDLLLHQTFHKCITLRITSSPSPSDSPSSSTADSNHTSSPPSSSSQTSRVFGNSGTITAAKTAPDTSPSKLSVPRVCMCTIDDISATCGAANEEWSRVAFGFETSDIQLIALGEKDLTPSSVPSLKLELPLHDTFSSTSTSTPSKTHDQRVKMTLRGHSGPVYDVAFLHDTNVLLSASEDTTLRAWCSDTGKTLAAYTGHSYPVWCVETSALGIYFASGSMDRTARLWTPERAYPLRIFAGHSQDVDCIRFHPNTKYIATGSSDRTVRMWNVTDGRMVRMFSGHLAPVTAIAFSPDGKWLASASEDLRVKVWDIGSASVLKESSSHNDQIIDLSFNHDNSFLASTSADKVVKVWDLRAKEANNNVNGTKDKAS